MAHDLDNECGEREGHRLLNGFKGEGPRWMSRAFLAAHVTTTGRCDYRSVSRRLRGLPLLPEGSPVSSPLFSRGIAALIASLLVVGSISATAPAFASEPTAEPTATAAATSTKTVTLTGSVVEIADEGGAEGDHDHESATKLFRIVGQGYLAIDLSQVTTDVNGSASIDVEVPVELDLGDTNESKFAALTAFTADGGELVAKNTPQAPGGTSVGRAVAEMVNQTPSTSAVHKIYAVLVTPSNIAGTAATAEQTAAKAAAAISHASTYWSAQSGGKITFALQGTVPWYKSAYSCETSTTSNQVWSEAATKAAQQIGYVDAQNTHLVLFFPEAVGTNCSGGAIGLASVGASTNSGGVVWSAGTDSNIGKSTLSHELGHNLSYGHANWADCDTATPQPGAAGTTGCTIRNYGDILDVMGFGISQFTGGTLSAPHAIRSGIWDDSAFAIAASNTTQSYTLNAVSSNSGLRSVIVEDNLGVNYFVEFRNYTGSDAQYSVGAGQCNTSYCLPAQSGVRILRLAANSWNGGIKGGWGDDDYLIGRTVSGAKRVNYTTGESFSTGGISITVSSMTSTTATVSVVKPAGVVVADTSATGVQVVGTVLQKNDGYYYPGDTVTAVVSNNWRADDYAFQWYLWNGSARVAIPGETGQSYVFKNSDVGKPYSVTVTGLGTNPATVTMPDPMYTGYTGIRAKTMTPGTASVSNATNALTVVTAGWEADTTFTYQWMRGSTAISGATGASYTPTQADRGANLAATVTGTKPGYASYAVSTPAKNFSVNATGTFAVTGTPSVGQTLSLAENLTYTTVDGAVTINSRSYEWQRDGVTISGATAATYTTTNADAGRVITAKMFAGATGWIAYPATSSPTAAITAGAGVAGTVSITNATDALTAVPSGWASGTTFTYQWYRGTTAISGATASTYALTTADRANSLKVEITGTAPGYTPVSAVSAAKDYSLVATGNVTISGATTVGSTLTLNDGQTYSTADGTKPIASRSYEWSRDGVIISGATSSTYVTVAADAGKLIFAKLTSRATGYIPLTTASGPTGTITIPTKAPGAATVSVSGFDLNVATSGWDAGTTFTYQWYRESDAIAGATASSYTPSQTADRGYAFKVAVTGTQPGYAPATRTTALTDYNAYAYGTIAVSGTPAVGSPLGFTESMNYTYAQPANRTYQWYANAVAISGATASTYTPVGTDVDKSITVRVVANFASYLSHATTSAGSDAVAAAPQTAGTVTITNTTNALTAVTTGWDSNATLSYKWLRGATAISGATESTYTPTQADRGSALKVEVTATRAGYTTVSASSAAKDYSLTATGNVTLTGTVTNGSTLTISDGQTYTTADGTKPIASRTYEWLRDGTTIASATGATYVLTGTDVGKVITAKVTSRATGYIALTTTSTATAAVAPGTKAAGTVTISNATNALTAVTAGWDSGTTFTYKWFRGATAISGATSISYTPVAADRGNALKVEVTGTQPGFVAVAATSPAKDYSLTATGSVTLTGATSVGSTLTVTDGQTYATADGSPTIATRTYLWYRDGALISSATASTYTLVSADLGKAITAQLTSTATGYIALSTVSTATAAVTLPTKAAGTVTISNTTDALTVVAAGWDPGTTYTYQWFRGATAITGATNASYTPTQADRDNTIKVTVVGTQPGFQPATVTSAAKDYSLTATGSVTLTGTAANGSTLTIADGQTYTTADGSMTVTKSYEWLRDGTTIASATASTYTLTATDIGKVITAKVTSRATGYIALTTTSAPSATVVAGTKAAGNASINNSTDTLTVVTTGWDSGTTYTYKWFRGATAISGATSNTYVPVAADRGNALKVEVTGIQPGFVAATATSPAKDYSLNATGSVTLTGSATNGSTLTVADGQTYTTVDGSATIASRSYEWFRDGTAIASATGSTFALTSADLGKVITAKVTSRATGYIALTTTSTATAAIGAGTKAAGTVTISNASNTLAAVTAGWDSGTTFTYKWFRGATAISGATAGTYTPVEADRGNAIKVEATGTQPGFVAVAAQSPAKDYSLNATGTLTVTGSATVGSALALASTLSFSTVDGAVSNPDRSYQWYRDGTAIASATGPTYTVVTADLGKAITAKLTATSSGYIAYSKVSTATSAVTLPSKAPGTATISNTTDTLTVVTAGWDTGTTFTYQWYRGAVAISGETAKTYTATSIDRDKALKVEVTGTQPGFLAASIFTPAKDFSINATGALAISGTAAVGATLSIADDLNYTTVDGAATISERTYQWYRDGVAIVSATNSTYTLALADLGKQITVKKSSAATGYITYSATTEATAAVVAGTKAAGTATISNATDELTIVTTGWDEGTTFTYKWFRGATAISGETGATYTPTTADRDSTIKAEVTGTQPGYVAVATFTPAKNYSLTATGSIDIVGSATVGVTLGLSDSLDYTTADGAANIASRSYVWLRDGEAIEGANGQEYTLVADDLGTQITARLTAKATGYIAHTATASATDEVGVPSKAPGDAEISNVFNELEVLTSGWDEGTTFEYQWLRGSSEIDGETTAFYTPTQADRGVELKVRVTGTQPGFLPATTFTPAKDFSITAVGDFYIDGEIDGHAVVGKMLDIVDLSQFSTVNGTPFIDSREYVWLRDGEVIAGATDLLYTPVNADLGSQISARITVTSAGWISYTATTAATSTVITDGPQATEPGTASISNESDELEVVTEDWAEGTTFSYQWLRDDVAIAGKTTAFYTLDETKDRGKQLSVEVTGTDHDLEPATVVTDARDFTITTDGSLTITGDANVGATLQLDDTLEFSTEDGEPTMSSSVYTWLRSGTAIAGATADEYKLVAADLGKTITVKLVSKATGYLAHEVTTAATAKVAAAAFTSVDVAKSGLVLTATPKWAGTATSGMKYAYQWYRGSAAISKATKSKYTIVAADLGKTIKVKITATKSKVKTVSKTSTPVNYTVTATPKLPTFSGIQMTGETLTLNEREYTNDGEVTSVTWLRNGKAIADATGDSYTLTPDDKGTVISVKVVATSEGYLSSTSTSVATQKIGDHIFEPEADASLVHDDTFVLTADPALGESGTDAKLTYKWLRDGKAISKATKASYKLVTADYDKKISVEITVTKVDFTTLVLVTDEKNFSVLPTSGTLKIDNTKPARGNTLTAITPTFDDAVAVSYQWYATGKAIKGATTSTFKVPSSYKGKVITVKVTAAAPGYLSYVKTSAKTAKVK